MSPVSNFNHQNDKLSAILKHIKEFTADGIEVTIQLYNHHSVQIHMTEGPMEGIHYIPLNMHSPRNLSFYQGVWEKIYKTIGPIANGIFETYKSQVYIHTGVFIQNKYD